MVGLKEAPFWPVTLFPLSVRVVVLATLQLKLICSPGAIKASSVVVEGRIVGSVEATGKVDLRRGCRVEGDITAGAVAAAEGSFFEGRIAMPQSPTPDVVAYEEKRSGSPTDS